MSFSFTFSRVPSVKTQVQINNSSLAVASNTLVLVGRKAASGATAPVYVPYSVENPGDPVAALAELTPLFGATSPATQMAITAIKANSASGNYVPLIIIPLASTDTSVEPGVAANLALAAPFVAFDFDGTVSQAVSDAKEYLQAISAGDRGSLGQFGSFGFFGMIADLAIATPIGVAAASRNLLFGWLPDSAGTPANTPAQIAAWTAALCAANGYPFMPLTDETGPGIVPPTLQSDWNTAGDSGTEALGLASGLISLMVGQDGAVHISRAVTSVRTQSGTPDTEYFDLQDWQSLYYIVQDFFTLANQPRYKIAKRSMAKVNALKSEEIAHLKLMEKGTDGTDGIVQGVDKSASAIQVQLPANNRSAAVLIIPADIVPGFYNKGLGLIGTDAYDTTNS